MWGVSVGRVDAGDAGDRYDRNDGNFMGFKVEDWV